MSVVAIVVTTMAVVLSPTVATSLAVLLFSRVLTRFFAVPFHGLARTIRDARHEQSPDAREDRRL